MMKIRNSISAGIKKFINRDADEAEESNSLILDVREEYANAFRTESYNEFWERVLELSKGRPNLTSQTSAARLPSYRLFVDHLLDPDQRIVFQTLALIRARSTNHAGFVSDYFSETANTFFSFSQLLKYIDHIRIKYKSLKTILDSLTIIDSSRDNQHVTLTRLIGLSNSCDPIVQSTLFPTPSGIKMVQAKCCDLLRQLESSRDKAQAARAKARLISKLKHGSAVFLVAITASLSILVAAHALALLVAAPGLVVASFRLVSAKKLNRWIAQLDTAAKGTYIMIKDLDLVIRLLARLNDELEHMQDVIQLLVEKAEERLQAGGEIVRQLKMNYMGFCEQLDELEEHLYLSLMTINRARNLVLKEIINQ